MNGDRQDDGRPRARQAIPFGCAAAAVLWASMAFVVFIGTAMGDCSIEDPACHANDDAYIAKGLSLSATIALAFGLLVWLAAATLLKLLVPRHGWPASITFAVIAIVLLVAVSFDPAMELLFRLQR